MLLKKIQSLFGAQGQVILKFSAQNTSSFSTQAPPMISGWTVLSKVNNKLQLAVIFHKGICSGVLDLAVNCSRKPLIRAKTDLEGR